MGEFKPIETQEELDLLIKSRIVRVKERYSDYEEIVKENESLKEQISELEKRSADIATLNEKINKSEADLMKTRIALEKGLPAILADRLQGSTEEDLKNDADFWLQYIEKPFIVPIGSNEPQEFGRETKEEAYRRLARSLGPHWDGI